MTQYLYAQSATLGMNHDEKKAYAVKQLENDRETVLKQELEKKLKEKEKASLDFEVNFRVSSCYKATFFIWSLPNRILSFVWKK